MLEVADDGRGGAVAGGGSGLIGLSDRVEALRGRLTVTSPARARGRPCAPSSRFPGSTASAVEDFVDNITRGNPGSVKAVLASVVLALATYQLILAAIGYRKLPVIDAAPAFLTHRASGDAIVVLFVLVALACLAVVRASRTTTAARLGGDRARSWSGAQGLRRPHRRRRRARCRTSASPCSRCWP